MGAGFFQRAGYWLSSRVGGFFWHLWMAVIVLTLTVIALPDRFQDAVICRISEAHCVRPVGQASAQAPLLDAATQRYDAIKQDQDRLFSLIVALAALLTFLGFKGLHSLVEAQTSAREAVEGARRYEALWQVQYPKDNRAEIAVAMAAALRDMTDMQLDILRQAGASNPERSALCHDYLEEARQHLEAVEDDECSLPIKLQVLGVLGNVYYRLGEYENALRVARKAISTSADDTDAYFNAACYLCKMAEVAERDKQPVKVNRLLKSALSYGKQYAAREEDKTVARKTMDEEKDLGILREKMQSDYVLLTA